jgi:hypothetical protein
VLWEGGERENSKRKTEKRGSIGTARFCWSGGGRSRSGREVSTRRKRVERKNSKKKRDKRGCQEEVGVVEGGEKEGREIWYT